MVKILNSMSDLEEFLKNAGDKLVVIDFFAVWCGPCNDIAPFVDDLSKKYPNAVFAKIDVDNEELSAASTKYEVNCMPTFKLIKNGVVKDTLEGADRKELEDLIKKHI